MKQKPEFFIWKKKTTRQCERLHWEKTGSIFVQVLKSKHRSNRHLIYLESLNGTWDKTVFSVSKPKLPILISTPTAEKTAKIRSLQMITFNRECLTRNIQNLPLQFGYNRCRAHAFNCAKPHLWQVSIKLPDFVLQNLTHCQWYAHTIHINLQSEKNGWEIPKIKNRF